MSFKSISIIGLGLIGGSIAKAVKNSNASVEISAYDTSSACDLALSEGVIDNKLDSIEDCLNSELILLSAPVEASVDIIKQLAPMMSEENVLTDVCGIKGHLNDVWSELGSRGVYIGAHPMTGKESGGYVNSDPLLFENAIYIISSLAPKGEHLDKFISFVKMLGARVVFLNPYQHDEVIAYVSHMPQLLSVSLINTVAKSNDINYMDFAGGGFRDMTRIASSSFDIWESVIKFNKNKIELALDNLIEELKQIKSDVQNFSVEELSEKFETSRRKRDEIPMNAKGFLNPLYDIFVFVKDEPGVISQISSTLFDHKINIKDIELLKIREGTGGTFRLSFESESDALNARKLLSSIGFSIKNH